jgi:outer membrane protein OmpA-like peptidoglycan-associated protein
MWLAIGGDKRLHGALKDWPMANEQPSEGTRITPRDQGKEFNRDAGALHRFILRRFEANVLDVEDVHFHLDSAVLLPDFSAGDPDADPTDTNRVTGLAALCSAYLHAEAHSEQKALIVGHTDRSGPEKYNLELSELRAANVLALLEGSRQPWADICQRKHRVEDYQTILKWVHRTWGWGCDPGKVDNVLGPKTRGATEVFQRLYNSGAADLPPGFRANIAVDGAVGPQTWGAFFDVYMRVLEQLLETDSAGLAARRQSIQFVDPRKTVGCGEYHPLTDNVVANRVSKIDRRVEILFFDPGEEPRLDCHPGPGVCTKDVCELYDRKFYRLRPIPAKPKPVPVVEVNLLHIHLDADRDGKVDDDWKENAKWEAGAGKKGAIILCNNDDENKKKKVDSSNDKVDTAADLPDIAPLVLRKEIKGKPCPAGWKAFLSVDDETKIRIFNQRADGGVEVVGPKKGKRYQIPDLTPDQITFGMEATQYPDRNFNGLVTITLEFQDTAGNTKNTEEAKVRVAPWVMFHHLYPTEETYVVDTGDNGPFLTELEAGVTAAGVAAPKRAARARYGNDRWMQDVMEVGFSSLPNSGGTEDWHLPVVLRTGNDRKRMRWGDTDKFPLEQLLGPGYGYVEALPPTIGNSLDSFGNLECSPPVTVGGKQYKFGRIVYGGGGREMLEKVREFFIAQKVQEPFRIDTEWLVVGHVDEVLSFCPMRNAAKKFKVLLASPKRAVDILKDLQANGEGGAKLFEGIRFGAGFTAASLASDYPKRTVDDILADTAGLMQVQTDVQAKIDGIEGTLKTELGLADGDFIKLPVLFKKEGTRYIAYTPGVVNMLVVTKSDGTVHHCVPKPFGPKVGGQCQFEKAIEADLGPAATTGVTLHFIDDFVTYHVLYGEIHCGTNSKRKPPTDRWWWEQDGI